MWGGGCGRGWVVMISVWLSDLATKLNPGILSAAVNSVILKLLCYAFDRSFDCYAFDRSFDCYAFDKSFDFRRRFIRLQV